MINRREFLWSSVLAGAAVTTGARLSAQRGGKGPAEVLLIRHAEEPEHGPDLSDRGRQRAQALVKLFQGRFPKPTLIYATATTKASARPRETVEPLAAALKIRINEKYADAEYKALANAVLHDNSSGGAHVLICWHHETIGELADALGVANPPKWTSSNYDGLWIIRYTTGKAVLTEESQKLLEGDK